MNLPKKSHWPVFLLYLIFGFGGLWHFLNLFQPAMRHMASPLLIVVSVWLCIQVYLAIADRRGKIRFVIWCILMVCFGWGIEYLGIRTGIPFGRYEYGPVLQPQIAGIPAVIGFSWLSVSLTSILLAQWIIDNSPYCKTRSRIILPVFTGLLMLLFDGIMEHAAPQLNYWAWKNEQIPIQNFLSWFGLGLVFSETWIRMNIRLTSLPEFACHVYFAQTIYFVWVLFKD